MNRYLKLSVIASVLFLTFVSLGCKKDEPNNTPTPTPEPAQPGKVEQVEYLDATKYGKWIYFSFAEGKEVSVNDPAKEKNWDVAFNREHIRINGQGGFSGSAAIANSQSTDFDKVAKDGQYEFVGNRIEKIKVKMIEMGKYEESEEYVSPFKSYKIDMDKMMEGAAAMYPVIKDVYLLRTADGARVAKMQILNSVNAQGKKGGTISLRYQLL